MLHMTRAEAMTLGTRIVVMKDGLIQQVDTPQNLYNSPNNLFCCRIYWLSTNEFYGM